MFKEKLTLFFITLIIFFSFYLNSEFVKLRFGKQLFWKIKSVNNYIKYFQDSDYDKDLDDRSSEKFYRSLGYKYFQLNSSGYAVFKKYPYFGVGNKNYRYLTCDLNFKDTVDKQLNNERYIC